MTDHEMNEEAHGLWELAIVRLAAFVEVGARRKVLREAVRVERSAFKNWQTVSRRVTAGRK